MYTRGSCSCPAFNIIKRWFLDSMPVASAMPYRLSFKYASSYPACDRCIVHSQPLCNLWWCYTILVPYWNIRSIPDLRLSSISRYLEITAYPHLSSCQYCTFLPHTTRVMHVQAIGHRQESAWRNWYLVVVHGSGSTSWNGVPGCQCGNSLRGRFYCAIPGNVL